MSTQPENAPGAGGGVLAALVGIVEEMTSDWDTTFEGQIGADTRLIQDLEFESIDIVQLIVAIETRFNRRDLPFEEVLMADGRYVDELSLGEVAEFLEKRLGA
jgi:acyl carrier protein